MEIVIKISEDAYNLLEQKYRNGKADVLDCIILNGNILPKGHGRLIDADTLEEKVEKHREMLKISEYDRELVLHYTDIAMAPTIIEGSEINVQ